MTRIDADGWKEFKLADVFRMSNTKSVVQRDIVPGSGTVPYVTAQGGNNGVMAYVDCPSAWLNEGGCIMIGGKTLTFSYQDRAFCSNDSHNIALHLKNAGDASRIRYLFLLTILRRTLRQRYSWADSISMRTIRNDTFRLPATESGDPDWAYMDRYMSAVMKESREKLEHLGRAEVGRHAIDASGWRDFRIGDLFDIEKGTRLTRTRMIAGDTPFIGASLENNGITARIGNTGHIHPGGLMTVAYNGQKATGKAFYQPVPFWASDDVNVLYPKFHLTENIALFLCPLFWEAGRPYAFENKWGKEIMKDGTISLPAGEDGQPDWRVIDSWMMGTRSTARTHLDLLGRFI